MVIAVGLRKPAIGNSEKCLDIQFSAWESWGSSFGNTPVICLFESSPSDPKM